MHVQLFMIMLFYNKTLRIKTTCVTDQLWIINVRVFVLQVG